jgi:hypothetical protein
MIPVKDHKGLYRDVSSSAIVNLDDNSYYEYLKTKTKLLEDQRKIENLENEISEIKKMLSEIIKNK